MPPDNPLVRLSYMVLAALAGSITALSFMQWKTMSRGQIVLTVFVGFAFAVFIAPWLGSMILGVPETNLRAMGAVTYVGGVCSNALIPLMVKRLTAFFDTWSGTGLPHPPAEPKPPAPTPVEYTDPTPPTSETKP